MRVMLVTVAMTPGRWFRAAPWVIGGTYAKKQVTTGADFSKFAPGIVLPHRVRITVTGIDKMVRKLGEGFVYERVGGASSCFREQ